ncbi:MAG: hypothetical protein Kow00120_10670 [Anaerolineae bacterium]
MLFAALLIVLLAVNVYATYAIFTSQFPGANDFYSRWSGARSFWLEGLDPYGDEASLAIQIGIYGRPVVEGEDPGYFAYPLYTVFLIAPLAPLPYAWAEAIWIVILEAALIGAMLLLADLFGWRPPLWLMAASLVWTLLFYPATRGLFLGQPGLAVYFFEVLALWALARGHGALAGAALALSTIKPQMGFLVVPALLLWGLWARRWRFVAAFAGVWGVLMALSFLALPSWFGSWLDQLAQYPSYTAIGSPLWVLTHLYLTFLGPTGEGAITVVLLILLAWVWWGQFRRGRDFLWVVCLTLTITHLVALRTATPHFVVFIIPLVFYFKVLTSADRRRGSWAVLLIEAALFVGMWALFLTTVQGRFEHPIVYLPLPFGMLLLLLATRKLWRDRAPRVVGQLAGARAPAERAG